MLALAYKNKQHNHFERVPTLKLEPLRMGFTIYFVMCTAICTWRGGLWYYWAPYGGYIVACVLPFALGGDGGLWYYWDPHGRYIVACVLTFALGGGWGTLVLLGSIWRIYSGTCTDSCTWRGMGDSGTIGLHMADILWHVY
jgi:hypothetical protein